MLRFSHCKPHKPGTLNSAKDLTKRLTTGTEQYLGKDQFGFRSRSGTKEAIAIIRVLGEKVINHDFREVCMFDRL